MNLNPKFYCLFFVAILSLGCSKKNSPTSPPNDVVNAASTRILTADQQRVKAITDSENLIQSLSTEMKTLARSFSVQPQDVSSFVSPTINYSGLELSSFSSLMAQAENDDDDPMTHSFYWPVTESVAPVPLSEVWKPLLDYHRLDDCQLGILQGTFGDGGDAFEMKTKFEGRFQTDDGQMFGVKGHQTLGWKSDGSNGWKLTSWVQADLKVLTARESFFENVTESAFPETATRKKLERSSHQELLLRRSTETGQSKDLTPAREDFAGFSDWYSVFQYPSVSVVDIDQDGYDDLFVTDRWQSAQLLRNKGNGTFEDVTEASGLQVDELANCAYFVDFDNDGDSDVFVGISMGPSKFFINENGTFKPDEATNRLLKGTRFVVSASVVDLNRDGLLDLFLSTYAANPRPVAEWFDKTTKAYVPQETQSKIIASHDYVDGRGPPNILLMNRGGKFDWVSIDDNLKQYRKTYQASWTDFDQDGDLDVYICNDFAPDVFLRNDTEQGSFKIRFTDVTNDVFPDIAMNFAMGASWGDFDNDGDLDLYVSNMYSKAGLRIVAQLENVDERIKVSARGNYLYENVDGKFHQVAGVGEQDQHVSNVGWSYGGQFADFDNDGELDIYVLSGMFSPPKEVHSDKDL